MTRYVPLAVLIALAAACSDSASDDTADASTTDASTTDASTAEVQVADAGKALRVFVTATEYRASQIGSLAGGDGLCKTAANAAALGGTWKAWLSDKQADAIDRVVGDGPWHLVTGARAFNNKANLRTKPLTAISVTEQGLVRTKDLVWTGTVTGGTLAPEQGGWDMSCEGWSTDNGNGQLGSCGGIDQWTEAVELGCVTKAAIYCFESGS